MPTPLHDIRPSDAAALQALLARQDDVIDVAGLESCGLDRHYAHRMVSARRWQPVGRGVWWARTGPVPAQVLLRAAQVRSGAPLDGRSALFVWGVPGHEPIPPVVVVDHSTTRFDGIECRQTTTLSDNSIRERKGLAVVTVERALISEALRSRRRARALLTEAVQRGHTTAERLRGTLLAFGRVRHRAYLRRVLDDIEGGSRSVLEALLLLAIRRHGLLTPQLNWEMRLDGRRCFLDMCWAELRICVEVDGRAFHLLCEDWDATLLRQNDIVLDGWLVLRFTAAMIRDNIDYCMDAIAEAIQERRDMLDHLGGTWRPYAAS